MKHIFMLLMALIMSLSLMAQQRTITGIVVDHKDGSAIIGASIMEKGTRNGVATDAKGSFTMNVTSANSILVISSIGYQKAEIKVGNNSFARVQLEEDATTLSEVVAVGYGTMRKSDLTGSVAQISGERLRESIVTNADQILQGRIAGVQVQSNSGAPGAATSIRIRGTGSINLTNEPLYVVDGIPMSGSGTSVAGFDWSGGSNGQNKVNPLAFLNPSDILSMDVLKDASATAIYGAAGANGVVIITTKRGQEGRSNIIYDGYVGVQTRPGKYNMMNLPEYATYQKQLVDEGFIAKNNIDQAYLDPSLLGPGTDWQDAVTKTAWMQNHNITMLGGTDKLQYSTSLGYTKQDGTVINSNFERYSGRLNIDNQFNKWVKIGGSLAYSRTSENIINNDGINGVIFQAALMMPSVPIYDFDGNYAGPETVNSSSIYNPVALTKEMKNSLTRDRVIGNIYASLDINNWINFRSDFSTDINNSVNKGFKPTYNYGLLQNNNASIMQMESHGMYWNWKNYFTITKKIGTVHSFNLMLGQEAAKNSWESQQWIKDNLSTNIIQVMTKDGKFVSNSGNKSSKNNASFFGRLNYNFSDYLLLTSTLRADGSSVFGANHQWGYFPSFAAAFRASEFLKKYEWLSNLKIRYGWGMNGNSNINNYEYGSTMTAIPTSFGTAYRMYNNANPDLKWEASLQHNLGIDLGLYNGRINLTIDTYYKTSKDLLLRPSVSPVLGGSSYIDIVTPMMNIGNIENKGIEISLNTHNIQSKDFNWQSNFVFSLNRNKVLELDNLNTPFYGKIDWYAGFQTVSQVAVGQPIGVFYGYQTDGLYKNAEDLRNSARPEGVTINRTTGSWVGDIKFVDQKTEDTNGDGIADAPDGVINEKDQVFIGDPNPDFTFGFTNTFTYKNWELGIGLNGSYGADILNYVRVKTEGLVSQWDNQAETVLNRAHLAYTNPNDPDITTNVDNSYLTNPDATIPRWSNSDMNGNNRMSDRWIEDGSYLRIQNISLAYNLSNKTLKRYGVQNCKIYVNAQNVYTFSNYSGLDPEIGAYNQGANFLYNTDTGRYPTPRIYTFGVKLTF
ncbi:TonB-dependent receptor [uncultured Paludibacter sp.]|uniref:TonB-dependent receptor n=1 Tax=uncultured Paludibacter sp. TaxID=497635 RepID=A0A653A9Q3_9BACT|nr:TonB-dependent receptor [uncultured Paludibacter sp.]